MDGVAQSRVNLLLIFSSFGVAFSFSLFARLFFVFVPFSFGHRWCKLILKVFSFGEWILWLAPSLSSNVCAEFENSKLKLSLWLRDKRIWSVEKYWKEKGAAVCSVFAASSYISIAFAIISFNVLVSRMIRKYRLSSCYVYVQILWSENGIFVHFSFQSQNVFFVRQSYSVAASNFSSVWYTHKKNTTSWVNTVLPQFLLQKAGKKASRNKAHEPFSIK